MSNRRVADGRCLAGWMLRRCVWPTSWAGGCRARLRGGVSASLLLGAAAFEAVAEAPALGAGVDDVRAVGDPVDDGLGHARVGEHFGPFAEREVGGHDQ